MRLFKIIILLLLNVVLVYTHAQYSYKGTVKDDKTGESLIGVNVKVNNSKGAITDFNGVFSLDLAKGKHKIVFSYVGYETKLIEIEINKDVITDITLSEESSELDVMVVSASKFEQKLEEVTVSVDVIGAKLIDSKNCVTLADVIRNAPGVQLIDGQLNIRAGSGWSYGTGSRVLVMVDDMPILSADQGEVEFNLIPMENIEQMEIIKGASSSLYGSSALNGVVNIKTKMPSIDPKTTIRSFVGLWDNPADLRNKWWGDTTRIRSGLSLTHSRKIKNFNMVLSASHYNDMGYIKTVNNVQTRLAANTKLVYDNITFGLNANFMKRESGMFTMWESDTNGYVPLDGTDLPNRGLRFYLDPSITVYQNFFKHTLRSRIMRRDILYNESGSNYITSLLTFNEYQNQYQNDQTTITSGLTLTTLMGKTPDNRTYNGQIKGNNISVYTQLDHKFGKLNVSTGARYEYFDLDDTIKVGKPLFRGGLNYQLAKGLNIRSSFGQGFRFPTITELFMEGDIGPVNLYRNPNLKPESGWTAEIGLKKVLKIDDFKGYIDIVGFVMEYNNMMEFTMGIWGPSSDNLSGLGFSSKNVGKTRIPGIELTVNGAGKITKNLDIRLLSGITYSYPYSVFPNEPYDYLPNNLTSTQNLLANIVLNGNNDSTYTFVNTSSDSTGLLKYRNHFTMRLDFELIYKDKFTIGFSHQYSSRMANIDYAFISPIFNTPPMGPIQSVDLGINRTLNQLNTGYHLFDFRLKYNIDDTFTLGFLCENLLNKSYLIRPAYMGSPRTFMFQLKKEF